MPAQSLYNFMSALNKNNVRTQNLFEMRAFIPTEMRNAIMTNAGQDLTNFFKSEGHHLTFWGQNFTLPMRELQYAEVGFKGFTVPVPTVMRMGQEHTVTINADVAGYNRRAFLAWQACVMNPEIAAGKGYFEGNRHLNNSARLYITLLDPTFDHPDLATDVYVLYGVTVGRVGEMQFSNTQSAVATFDVTFHSQYWQCLPFNNENWSNEGKESANILTDYQMDRNSDTAGGSALGTQV